MRGLQRGSRAHSIELRAELAIRLEKEQPNCGRACGHRRRSD
jgi:hypothetical protein